jgi:hypothetical protein
VDTSKAWLGIRKRLASMVNRWSSHCLSGSVSRSRARASVSLPRGEGICVSLPVLRRNAPARSRYNRSRAVLLLVNGKTDAGADELSAFARQGTAASFLLRRPQRNRTLQRVSNFGQ